MLATMEERMAEVTIIIVIIVIIILLIIIIVIIIILLLLLIIIVMDLVAKSDRSNGVMVTGCLQCSSSNSK